MASKISAVTVTGDVTAKSAYLKSVSAEGTVAGTVVVREGGSGGTVRLTLRVLAGDTVAWSSGDELGAFFGGGVHATITGIASATFVYEPVA
ncbi:MAG: hypothetical protein ACT4PO_06630 [Actinomycetota bacterium]